MFSGLNANIISYLCKNTKLPLFVPFYHIVSDSPVAHTKYLYPCKTVAKFRADLRELLRQFDPVDISQVQSHFDGSRPLTRPSFILTFDDGLHQCSEVIAPVLMEMGVPAVFFVNTAFLDNHDMLYRMKASILTDFVTRSGEKHMVSVKGGNKTKVTRQVLLSVTYPDRMVLDEIAKELGVSFDDYLQLHKPYMDTAQVQRLHHKGFAIGGHTHTHPDFRYLTADEQLTEARMCLSWLRENAGIDTHLFSFPFTDFWTEDRFFSDLKGDIDLFFGSAGLKLHEPGRLIERIDFENILSPSSFYLRQMVIYLVKRAAGRHRTKRFDKGKRGF